MKLYQTFLVFFKQGGTGFRGDMTEFIKSIANNNFHARNDVTS